MATLILKLLTIPSSDPPVIKVISITLSKFLATKNDKFWFITHIRTVTECAENEIEKKIQRDPRMIKVNASGV